MEDKTPIDEIRRVADLESDDVHTSLPHTPQEESPAEITPDLYTNFSQKDKRLLTVLLGLAAITSPLTATIYFPILPLLRTHFHTSAQNINLTITIYVIFQALSPAIFGPLSDSVGRRPIYILTLAIYLSANIGLAVNRDSYAALLVLRALQSLGASAAFSVTYGVVADVCVPSERGRMVAAVSMALNLGTCIGPVVGGCVAYKSGSYKWIFLSLVIVAALLLLGVVVFLPETARSIVGNGSGIVDQSRGYESWWTLSRQMLHKSMNNDEVSRSKRSQSRGLEFLGRLKFQNPFACLQIFFYYDTFFILWICGVFYLIDSCLLTASSTIYKNIYHFNELQIGLSLIPRGVGVISCNFFNIRLMDHNYKVIARKIGWTIDKVSGDDLRDFPIERARSRGSYLILLWSSATLVGFGWAVDRHAHVSIPLIMSFMQACWQTLFYVFYSTLLVDIFPASPSTASAAASIARCTWAATGTAVLQPMINAMGNGWYFSTLGLGSGVTGVVAVWFIQNKGMEWRRKRLATDEDTVGVSDKSSVLVVDNKTEKGDEAKIRD